jgi:hypothetical protein
VGNQASAYRVSPGTRSLLLSRDGQRQTVADLVQLVREIQVGVDVDGDGVRDLDPSHIIVDGGYLAP